MPLKDKTGKSIAAALTTIFQNRKPITIQSDKGTEFLNATAQQYLKRRGVDFRTTHYPDIKGAVIERFNRTLKTKMYKYFTKNNTYRYLHVINNLLASYNNSVLSTINIPRAKCLSRIFTLYGKNSLRAKIPHGLVKWAIL